jgi:DNA-directed RNA polymerase III subunit RPC1
MNLHFLQTEEAKAEAKMLMGVQQNLVTPRNGEPLVAASQDFLTASYMLTQRDRFFTHGQFCQLASYYGDATEHVNIPFPAILKPIELWTGKQVFSMLLAGPLTDRDASPVSSAETLGSRRRPLVVNFEAREKNYTSNCHFCPNDGWVAFRNSELISGNIAKKSIGDGSKSGLLYVLLRDCGPDSAAACLGRWAKFSSRYLGAHQGLSFGISDVTPSERLHAIKQEILLEGYRKVSAPSAFGIFSALSVDDLVLKN